MSEFARYYRQFRVVGRALVNRDQPILAQIVPIRRCNLSCAYCTEYDKDSDPVPIATMLDRIDRLAELGTSIVTISGGEPMLHPDLDDIIRRIRERDMIAGLITNGFYLVPERIAELNDAGLEYLQISIDKVEPDEISQKSLKSLDKKLEYLSEYARFQVNINPVVGAGITRPADAVMIAKRAAALGFSVSVGILHDEGGQLKRLTPDEVAVYDSVVTMASGYYTRIRKFQQNLVDGLPNDWHCLAGARYLYVCEDGLVHYCSQQRGTPGIPLERYGVAEIRRSFATPKSCAPLCTVGCVHRASALDNALHNIGLRGFAS